MNTDSLKLGGKTLALTESQTLANRGKEVIAGFTQSMMKKPEQFAPGHFPIYLKEGHGAIVTDVDDNEYIDFICGLAANSLGHNHPSVNKAITNAYQRGLIHSLPTPVEVTTAEKLTQVIPGGEMVRFFKTGADANSAAIRLARHLTQKEKIVAVGYNGWHDQYQFDTPGVPKVLQDYTYRMPLFTQHDESPLLELIKEKGHELAAVLLSVPYNRTLTSDYVQRLKKTSNDHGVMFIIDEVVTGFRLALGGAQEFFGVAADIVTLSKGLAAGMPLSAVVASRNVLSRMDELQVSTTFGGEMLSLEVCSAAIDEYRTSNYFDHIASLGRLLKNSVNKVSQDLGTPLKVVGYDPIPMFLFAPNPAAHAKIAEPFLAEMAKRGVIMRREVNFICAAHTVEQIELTVAAVKDSLEVMRGKGLFKVTSAVATETV